MRFADGEEFYYQRFAQVCKRSRSLSGIWRSSTRCARCCHTARGRPEKRIFGNGVFSEDCTDQVFSGFFLFSGLFLVDEGFVGGSKIFFCLAFGLDAAFGQRHEGAADCEVAFFGKTAEFGGYGRWYADALTERTASQGGFGLGCHDLPV